MTIEANHQTSLTDAFIADAAKRCGDLYQWAKRKHKQHRAIQQLSEMDDYMLRDMGITRGEIIAAVMADKSGGALLRN